MMKKYLLLIVSFFTIFLIRAQQMPEPEDTIPHHLEVIFAGDIMGHDAQIASAYDSLTKTYNYDTVFKFISPYILQADLAIANFEVTLAGPPYKGYPQFSSPDELAVAAKNAGFDILANANNHALDGRAKGLKRTLDVLDSLKIVHMGTYRDSLERDSTCPLIIEKNSIKLALLNYTYGTNGLTISPPYIVNYIDTAAIRRDIEKAKSENPDKIIVFLHWGTEYERDENTWQKNMAKYIFSKGADVIIGSHPHVIQPIRFVSLPGDTLKKYPVVYSMGNFVSNQRARYKDGGIVAELHFSRMNDSTTLDSLSYLPYWVWRNDESDGRSTFSVLPVKLYESDTAAYQLSDSDRFRLRRFAKDTRNHLTGVKESDYYK